MHFSTDVNKINKSKWLLCAGSLQSLRWLNLIFSFYSEISSLHDIFTRVLRIESSSPVPSHTISTFVSCNDSGRHNNRGGNRGGFNGSRGSQHSREAIPTYDSGRIICYYCREPRHTKKTCLKLQNKNQRSQIAHMAIEASFDKGILISADTYAQFIQY
ncbi:hypothetical protein MANES_16G035125v8 [Manihot esculenta]|uniref:Uncharacterized protein n=1 Tax=Manihot esculenta TaxID=3983 RepID=A0ACB7G581_MANES|nr:hypothetical protein MANES_16G035125v8 [Manihot esculenta]